MKVWTIQIAQWREADRRKIPLLDTTFKSGDPVFAPPRKLVLDYKGGAISEEEYTEAYTATMRQSWLANRDRWVEVCNMEEVAVACYCSEGKFCHRHILKRFFIGVCAQLEIPVEEMGEVKKVKQTGV